jgi:TolB-like protein/class 3 adenylate cyclase/Tfp pilus assembly protein PilF
LSGARKLAAILAADVVGYSRLMGLDEAGTAKAVRERREAATPILRACGGRLVKTTGDGVLMEFSSVVAAVECAILMQKMMAGRNAPLPETKRILYRIGVNLGDVLIEGDDILGDGVNVAARLEAICEVGGVCVSSSAHEHVDGRIAADFANLGEQALKNIARPVRAFALSPSAVAAARVEMPEATAPSPSPPPTPERREPPRLSIVVLPFANIGGDPEQEYFVDGVTDSLTTDLSRIRGAFVIARNTAFTFKGKPIDVKAVGRELNVRYALEGSVLWRSDRMRVNVELVDAESGAHLWAERFDKPIGDFFDTQDEIVARLANQLSVEIMGSEARRSELAPAPDSFDLFLRGASWFHNGPTPENLARAQACLEHALALDPDNVEALVKMSMVDFQHAVFLFSKDRATRLATAEKASVRALHLAREHARAHLSLGTVLCVTNRAEAGIAECERALAIDPNLAAAHGAIAAFKAHIGRDEETEAHVREALRLSPRDGSVFLWLMFVGGANVNLGRYEEAIVWLNRSIEANRNNPLCHFHLAGTYALLGRLEDARTAARTGLALNPDFTVARFRASPSSDNARYAAAHELFADALQAAGVPEK